MGLLKSFLVVFLTFAQITLWSNHSTVWAADNKEATTSPVKLDLTFDAGPGPILPSSPLFFLDNLWDNIRLLFTIDPESRAKLRLSIAAERLSEIRNMLETDRAEGINIALSNLESQIKGVKKAFDLARKQNRPLFGIARELVLRIEEEKKILQTLQENADEMIRFKLKAQEAAFDKISQDMETGMDEGERSWAVRRRLQDSLSIRAQEASRAAGQIFLLSRQLAEEATRAGMIIEKRYQDSLKDNLSKEEQNKLAERKNNEEQLLKNQVLKISQSAQDQTSSVAIQIDKLFYQTTASLRELVEENKPVLPKKSSKK